MARGTAAGAVTEIARGVRFATADDDAALRALLRRSVMPGAVRVAFTREPSYAASHGLAGADDATVVWERDGALTAMGRCSVRTLHRNGKPARVAYLGELRFDPTRPTSARGMRDGYALLAEFAQQVGAEGCFTSIADDNARARRVLENGGRLGLPAYRSLFSLVTLLAPVGRVWGAAGDSRSEKAAEAPANTAGRDLRTELEELTQFLERHAQRHQLSLTWDRARWQSLARHGVDPGDFVVVREHGTIVAAAAVWDQRQFRQTVIDGYTGVTRVARPLVNLARTVGGLAPLPAPGETLAQGSIVGATVDAPAHWPALWRAVCARAAQRGLVWLSLAREAADAELEPLRALLRPREYRTTLYDVIWRDRPGWREPWHVGHARPEVGLL